MLSALRWSLTVGLPSAPWGAITSPWPAEAPGPSGCPWPRSRPQGFPARKTKPRDGTPTPLYSMIPTEIFSNFYRGGESSRPPWNRPAPQNSSNKIWLEPFRKPVSKKRGTVSAACSRSTKGISWVEGKYPPDGAQVQKFHIQNWPVNLAFGGDFWTLRRAPLPQPLAQP
jgi:hypothetical protein